MTTRAWITAVAVASLMLGLYVFLERRGQQFKRLAAQLARASRLAKLDQLRAEHDVIKRAGERYDRLAHEVERSILLVKIDLLQAEVDSSGCMIPVPAEASRNPESSDVEGLRARSLLLQRLSQKYAFAAQYPYLPVWPDPKVPRER